MACLFLEVVCWRSVELDMTTVRQKGKIVGLNTLVLAWGFSENDDLLQNDCASCRPKFIFMTSLFHHHIIGSACMDAENTDLVSSLSLFGLLFSEIIKIGLITVGIWKYVSTWFVTFFNHHRNCSQLHFANFSTNLGNTLLQSCSLTLPMFLICSTKCTGLAVIGFSICQRGE